LAGAGGYSVVWWDPTSLDLGKPRPFGVRREDLIVKDVPKHVIADGRAKYDRWKLARHDARAAGSSPSIRVKTVREWSEVRPETDTGPTQVRLVKISTGADEDRPAGVAFGSLVHALLAQAPFDADDDQLMNLARIESRVLGMSDADARAAAAIAKRALAHELLIRARDADRRGACRRETPMTWTMPDGLIVEGIVDLAFEEHGSWTVVDYKTDRELALAGEEIYRRQVLLYASAIAEATGMPASAVLARI
jgi:ATP-dependent exoDNAse (exonuclease V) beta subunit